MAEQDEVSALSMDRGLPLGNSEDTFLRRALHVKVANKPTEAIPVYVTEGEPSEAKQAQQSANTTGANQTLISLTVPVGKVWDISKATLVTRSHGKFIVNIDGNLRGSGRTGPSIGDLSSFRWEPRLSVSAGSTVEIIFKSTDSNPTNEVEAYFGYSERNA